MEVFDCELDDPLSPLAAALRGVAEAVDATRAAMDGSCASRHCVVVGARCGRPRAFTRHGPRRDGR